MSYRVYCYTSGTTGKKYIGTTTRKYQSKRAGKGGSHYIDSCPKFGKAILEYGCGDFEYSVLYLTEDKEEAYKMEKYYIAKYDTIENGYNISIGGRSGATGTHPRRTEEFKSLLSSLNKGKPRPEGAGLPPRKVLQYTKEGELIAEYPSIGEASRETHTRTSGIVLVCKNRRKTSGGYIWRYAV